MKYVMTLFWTLIFGFVVGFIGSKLVKLDFNVQATLTVSVIFGILLNLVPLVLPKDPVSIRQKGRLNENVGSSFFCFIL
ncbi:YjzD family protein [Latilactobacillus sakei]